MLTVALPPALPRVGALPAPTRLRVEGLDSPDAVLSEPSPRFSFVHPPSEPGVRQTSYCNGRDGPLWDSGDVQSEDCTEIIYAGSPLKPFTRYLWNWLRSLGGRDVHL